VTKIIHLKFINLVTPKVPAKHELLFNKPASEHWPVQLAQAAVSNCVRGHLKIMAPHVVPNQKSKQKHSLGIAMYLA
jgi:hypothetical protein